MFNVHLSYPSFADELTIVKNTTSNTDVTLNKIINASQIQYFQKLIRNIPVTDNVVEYAVKLVGKTRPNTPLATEEVNKYINWGAGPRASQFLVIGAKCHAAITGKYAPDIEDVQAVAEAILRHRIVRNYRAEAEGLSIEHIIKNLY
ncbi:hypothetical protein D3C87_1550290 [compost metagenome]